jgi:hypothetical protein
MENNQLSKYLSAYPDEGLVFAPLVMNSPGKLDPDLEKS